MPTRLACITNHFFDLPLEGVPATAAGSPHSVVDVSSSGSPYHNSPLRRHGGRNPAAAAAAAMRRGGNNNTSSPLYGRPSSPGSSVALTPPQSPASPIGSSGSFSPTFVGSPRANGGVTSSVTGAHHGVQHQQNLHTSHLHAGTEAGVGVSSSFRSANRAARHADASENYNRLGSPSSPLVRAPPTAGFERGPTSRLTSCTASPHAANAAARVAALRTSGQSSRALQGGHGAAHLASGLPSPNRSGAANIFLACTARPPTSSASAWTPSLYQATDPSTSLYTEADAELLLHPLMRYVQDENALRFRAAMLRRQRAAEVTVAVDALSHPSAYSQKICPPFAQHQVILRHDYVLHARCSKLLAAVGQPDVDNVAATGLTSGAGKGVERKGGVIGPAEHHYNRSSGKSSRRPSAVVAAAAATAAGSKRSRGGLPNRVGPADPLTSAPGGAASLYLLEMTGQVSKESGEASKETTLTGSAPNEVGSPRTDSSIHGGFASSSPSVLPSRMVQRRRPGPRLLQHTASCLQETTASPSENKVADGNTLSKQSSSCVAAQGGEKEEVEMCEEEISLMFSHNVFANYRTLPLQFAHHSYELLPARYRAGLDAISDEVLRQQQQHQMQCSGGVIGMGGTGSGGSGGGRNGVGGSSGSTGAMASNNSSNNTGVGGVGVGRRADGGGTGLMPGASSVTAECGDVWYIGGSYLNANGDPFMTVPGSPYTASSAAPSPHPGGGLQVAPYGEAAGMWPGVRSDMTASPLPPSCAMEERNSGAAAAVSVMDDATTPATTTANASLPFVSVPVSPLTTSFSIAATAAAAVGTLTTCPNTANNNSSASGPSVLHYVHRTIQSFVARGEREVALHYIIAVAPYRIPGLSNSDRVLALFNQIRFFFPSPRFSTVLMAMEAWRSLYRSSVGAGTADYTHMTQELLSLVETYLCHGRTYAEYVSGLLMLRAVLSLAMVNTCFGTRSAALLLQHRALVQERLPTLLLAVWMTLMDYYTIDDLPQPPRRVLRDLAANAMQDLFTVALELQMVVPVQNVVANAVNVFFGGPHQAPPPPLQHRQTPAACTGKCAATAVETSVSVAENKNNATQQRQPQAQRRCSKSPPLGECTSGGSRGNIGSVTAAAGTPASDEQNPLPVLLNTGHHAQNAGPQAGASREVCNGIETRSAHSLSRPAHSISSASAARIEAETAMHASESPTLTVPTAASSAATRISYRALTKSVWRSVKQVARRLISKSPLSASVATGDVMHTSEASNVSNTSAAAALTAHGIDRRPGQQHLAGGAAPQRAGVATPATATAASTPDPTYSPARRFSPACPSPLLIEVPDDVLLEVNTVQVAELLATPSMSGWSTGSLSIGANTELPSPRNFFPRATYRPDLLDPATLASTRHDEMLHSPTLLTAPSSSATFHAFSKPASPLCYRPLPGLRHEKGGFGDGVVGAANGSSDWYGSSNWADMIQGTVQPDGGVSRDALWAMPLALGLRAAGRPLTLDSTVAAATLTLGAFLCAWRIAGQNNIHDSTDRDDEEEGARGTNNDAGTTGSRTKRSAYSTLIPQPPPTIIDSATSNVTSDPLTEVTTLPGRWRDSCELGDAAASSTLTNCVTAIKSSPGCCHTPEPLLPLLTEEEVQFAVVGHNGGAERDSGSAPASPTSAMEPTRSVWGSELPFTGRQRLRSVNDPSTLSARLAAMTTTQNPVSAPYLYDRSEATVETDPEWQSLEEAAQSVYLPAIMDMEATSFASVGGGSDDYDYNTPVPLAEEDETHNPDRTTCTSASPMGLDEAASDVMAKNSSNSAAISSLNVIDAPESLAAALATRHHCCATLSVAATSSASVPSRQHPQEYHRYDATVREEGTKHHVGFHEPVSTEYEKRNRDGRTGLPARSNSAAASTSTAKIAAATTPEAPPLSFFLPPWTVTRLVDRCLHPVWGSSTTTATTTTSSGAHAQTDNPMNSDNWRAAGSAVRDAGPSEKSINASSICNSHNTATEAVPLEASVETQVLMTSLMPLLSQYYGSSFSEEQLTACVQLLVNRTLKVMRIISQAMHRSTDNATVNDKSFAGIPTPSSASTQQGSHQPQPQQCAGVNTGSPPASTIQRSTTTRRGSVVDTGTLLPSCVFGLGHDSAMLDGTELVSAVLFICTVAERYPALFETVVSRRLYPLLHLATRLMAFEEEPLFWLPTPYPSTAAWRAAGTPAVLNAAAVAPGAAAANALSSQVCTQWMMLTAARSMFQRVAMPALLLIAHNMPSVACAQRCAPLVDRLVQIGLRQPFSSAFVTTAACICAVFPSLGRVCQAELARGMSIVLSTADDVSEEMNGRDAHQSNSVSGEANATTTAAAAPAGAAASPHRNTTGTAHSSQRSKLPDGYHEMRRTGDGALLPGRQTSASTTATAATITAKPDAWQSYTSVPFSLPVPPMHLPRRSRPSAATLHTAQRHRAAQVRLLKHHIFRALTLFPSSWEGTTLFFLEFCLPYLHHPDAQLRLECVRACTNWPFSECWHSVKRTAVQLAGPPHANASTYSSPEGGGDASGLTSAPSLSPPTAGRSTSGPGGGGSGGNTSTLWNAVPSISITSFVSTPLNSLSHITGGRRATLSAAVTRLPVRDVRTEDRNLAKADAASSPCCMSFANANTTADNADAFPAGPLSAVRAVRGVKRGQTLSAAAALVRSGAGLPMRDSNGLLGMNTNTANINRNSITPEGVTGTFRLTNTPAALVGGSRTQGSRGAATTSCTNPKRSDTPMVTLHTVEHHGRTHINALREIVHHLVETAVCDPEPLVRRCALGSLTPETYQLLYPHEAVLHQLFTVLWDSHLSNRVQAAQLLCALAPLNPSFIYPRLRDVMVRYIADMTRSTQSLGHRNSRQMHSGESGNRSSSSGSSGNGPATAAATTSVGISCVPCVVVQEDSLYVLSHIASRLKQSTPLYLPQLLSIVYSVLRCPSSGRGAVLQAMHLLIFLRDDSTQEQSALFDPFVDLIAGQLTDGEGDTPRVLAAVAALQTLLQSAEPSQNSPQSLPVMVECLHSLLYRKPSVGTDFSMAVLQLLGTISTIEPWHPEMPPQAPALLRRPQNRYAIPPISSLAGVLGNNTAMCSLWPVRAELADNAHQALEQLQKVDRFMPFKAMVWPDTVLRALTRTLSCYVNGTMSLTQDGLGECLLAIMKILTNTMVVRHLDLYLPSVLTLVIDLLERKDARPLQSRPQPSPFFMAPENHKRSTANKESAFGEGGTIPPLSTRDCANGGGNVRGCIHGNVSENLWLLFLRGLFDLVLIAGRRIAPMYPLLNVFLLRSWQQTTLRGMVQCCEVLDALCWSVPDLLRVDCDRWITMLLSALMHYDAFVLTHRRAHETAPGTTGATTTSTPTNANPGGGADAAGMATGAGGGNGEGQHGSGAGGVAREMHTRGAPLNGSFLSSNEAYNAVAAANTKRVTSGKGGSTHYHPNNNVSTWMNAGDAAKSAYPSRPVSPFTPADGPNAGSGVGAEQGRDEDAAEASLEGQLKLVYRALTMCLTSLRPISSPPMRRLVCLCLSDCLKSSHVPQMPRLRAAATTAAKATRIQQPTASEMGGSDAAVSVAVGEAVPAPHSFNEANLHSSNGFVAHPTTCGMFDLMSDPHEELISFINTCVCGPLLDYMLHAEMKTVSMKILKSVLARLESLSMVHEEALRRVMMSATSNEVFTAATTARSASHRDSAVSPEAAETASTTSSAAAAAGEGVRAMSESVRVVWEARLREARELLYAQRLRRVDDPSFAAAGSGDIQKPPHEPVGDTKSNSNSPYSNSHHNSAENVSGGAASTPAPLGARAAKEVVWFSNSPLSRMWVQSTDHTTTVRRYFPFDAVQTSWEAEGEMHLVACLFTAAAWRRPASTVPFIPVLYTFVAQRFGPESLVMSYMRCVCSSYYSLCMSLLPMSEEEGVAVNWVCQNQQLQLQLQQQQQHRMSARDMVRLNGDADGSERDGGSLDQFTPRAAFGSSADVTDATRATQDTDASNGTTMAREGRRDVILVRLSTGRGTPLATAAAASGVPLDGNGDTAPTTSISSHTFLVYGAHPRATFNTSSTGSRSGSCEAEAPLPTVVTAEGELSSVTSMSRFQGAADVGVFEDVSMPSAPGAARTDITTAGAASSRLPYCRGGTSTSAGDFFSFTSPVPETTASGGTAHTTPATAAASPSAASTMGGLVAALAPASSDRLLSANLADSNGNSRRSAETKAITHFFDSDGDRNGAREETGNDAQCTREPGPQQSHRTFSSFSTHLLLPQQQQSQQRLNTTVSSIPTVTTGGVGSLTHTATAVTIGIGSNIFHSPSTSSPPSMCDQSPAAMTLPIPVKSGSCSRAGAVDGYIGFPPSGLISENGSGSGPTAMASSFFPCSFFSNSIGDTVSSNNGGGDADDAAGGSAGRHQFTNSVSGHSVDGHGPCGSAAHMGSGGGGSSKFRNDFAATRSVMAMSAANASHSGLQLPLPVAACVNGGLHRQLPHGASASDLTTPFRKSTTPVVTGPTTAADTAGMGLIGPLPSSVFTVGSYGAAASLSRRCSLLARPSPFFGNVPPAGESAGLTYASPNATLSRSSNGGGSGGGSPLWHPPLMPMTTSGESLTYASRALGMPCGGDTHLLYESPLQPYALRQPNPPTPVSQHHCDSNPGTPVQGLTTTAVQLNTTEGGSSGSGVLNDAQQYLETLPMEVRNGSTLSPPAMFSVSTSTQQPPVTAAAAAAMTHPQSSPLYGPPPAPEDPVAAAGAANTEGVFTSLPGLNAPYDTIATQHRNSLIPFFELHRHLRAHGWRSWWEQFSLLMVECSQDYCVKACEAFVRHHHIAFAYTELLPVALLSTLPSCTVAELIAWLQALRTFYLYHTEPGNSVPQQVTTGVAQLAHEIRLHRSAFFPPEIVSQVIDVWLPDGVVADLAHHSLNPPLRILYLEQDLARAFSWNKTALLMSAMEDITSSVERRLFVQDRRFQQWLRSATGGMETASIVGAISRDSLLYPPDVNGAVTNGDSGNNSNKHVLRFPRSAAGPAHNTSSCFDGLPPSVLELLGFYRAAALEYTRIYTEMDLTENEDGQQQSQNRQRQRCGIRALGSNINNNTTNNSNVSGKRRRVAVTSSVNTPERAITAAMRCYICLYDFESVLRLWDMVKKQKPSSQRNTTVPAPTLASENPATTGEQNNKNGHSAGGDVAAAQRIAPQKNHQWGTETARYVALAAQALSKWEYVADTARFMRTSHLPWLTTTTSLLLKRTVSVGQFSPDATLTNSNNGGCDSRLRSNQSLLNLATDRWGSGGGGEGEEEAANAFFAASTGNASTEQLSDPSSPSANATKSSLLERQQEVFLGAALVASHDYEGARQVLGAVRKGLRDSYAVFHTNNIRIKLEWSCIFQQLSDLEEGIHTLEQAAAICEDGTSGATTIAAAAAGMSSESKGTCLTWSGSVSPVVDLEVHGRVYPEVTIQRLRNIVCRPLSATTSPLQRFMMIATRSAIAPISWQLDNIVTLCEILEKGGQPMRAVQVLHRYWQLAMTSASSAMSRVSTTEYKQQLHLETLRRMIRHLPHESGLREMYACVQTALRQDLWQSRCAVSHLGQLTSSASFFSWGASGASTNGAVDPLFTVISDATRRRCTLLDAQELGPSLTSYQVDLLLLSVACRRRLAHVLLHNTPLMQRAATGGVRNHRSDTPSGAVLSPPCVSVSTCVTPVPPPHLACGHKSKSGEGSHNILNRDDDHWNNSDNTGFTTYPHSPVSPSMARQLIGFPVQDKDVLPSTSTNTKKNATATGIAAVAVLCSGGRDSSRADGWGNNHASCAASSQEQQSSRTGEKRDFATVSAATDSNNAEEDGAATGIESLTGESALFVEYYLLEHVVTVTNYVPSVWREFGLVLFDICLAIHAEWKTTADEETKQNFLTQSAKAIHGLQLAAQLWESGSASALGRGLGPFPAMSQRRHRHARTALPSTHLLLKALHLAITCELIERTDPQTPPTSSLISTQCTGIGTATAPTAAAGASVTNEAATSSPTSRVDTAHSQLSFTPAERSLTAEGTSHHDLDTVGLSAVSATPSSSHQTIQPDDNIRGHGGDDEKEKEAATATASFAPAATVNGGHPTPGETQAQHSLHGSYGTTAAAFTSKKGAAEREKGSGNNKGSSASASVPHTLGGFSCLDFSAASYAQWAAIAPLLIAAATRHPTIYDALRDMCVRSRPMLRQLIFSLIANFEHGYDTLFVQRTNQVSRGAGLAGTQTTALTHTTALPNALAVPGAGYSDLSQDQADSFRLRCASSTPTAHSSRDLSVAVQEHQMSFRALSKSDLWGDDAGEVAVVCFERCLRSGSSSAATEAPSLHGRSQSSSRRRASLRARGGENVASAGAAANDAVTRYRADTATTDMEYESASLHTSASVSDADNEDVNAPATFSFGNSDGNSDHRTVLRLPGPSPMTEPAHLHQHARRRMDSSLLLTQQQLHSQQQCRQPQHQYSRRGRQVAPASLREPLPSFGVMLGEEGTLQSLLLTDVAAASAGHYQHIHEAMQLRDFVRRSWDTEATFTCAAGSATHGGMNSSKDAVSSAATTSAVLEVEAGGSNANTSSSGSAGRSTEGAASPALDSDVALSLEEADGSLRAMELVLSGHCPLPVPLWLLSSVFGTATPVVEDGSTGGQAAAAVTKPSSQYHGNTENARRKSGNVSSTKGATNSNTNFAATGASAGPAGPRQADDTKQRDDTGGAAQAADKALLNANLPYCQGMSTLPPPQHAATTATTAAAAAPPPDAASSTVPFSPSTVPGVVHARRYLVPHPAPHHRKEELIFLMLSDGATCRLRHVIPAPPRPAATSAAAATALHTPNSSRYSTMEHLPVLPPHTSLLGKKVSVAGDENQGDAPGTAAASSFTNAVATGGEEVRFVVPHSLMEQTTSMLLSHLPLGNLQRPFVLPLGLRDYLTLLPEQTSGPVFGATVTAAMMHAENKKNCKKGMAFLTGESSAALNVTASLLTPSSVSSSARGTLSLHHLMNDYTVHLRVREMAQAAHDAVELYPSSDFEATCIAAETGRGPGVQSDNSFPFNWAYGYPASAPPSEAAMTATLTSPKYHDLVRQRKMSELRYDQLVAMAYNKGNVEQLVAYVRELLAARPPATAANVHPSSPPPTTTALLVSVDAAQHSADADTALRDSADDVYARQQRLYAYLATLPRTEAHLKKLLTALEGALVQRPSANTAAAAAVAPYGRHDKSSGSSNTSTLSSVLQRAHSPAVGAAPPPLLQETESPLTAALAGAAAVTHAGNTAADTATHKHAPSPTTTSTTPPITLTPPTWQACRLVLTRVESSRCRAALAEAFSADSSDATHWLDVRRTYAKELAEWSVIQYLFDTFGRECGDVMVNTYDGHVAMHTMGRYSLQKACCVAAARRPGTCVNVAIVNAGATPTVTGVSESVASLSAPAAPESVDPLVVSPFPTRDPTLFRLTPVLQAGLPMQSPHALFQYRAASALCDIYMYVRDLAGIATYGIDRMAAFAYTIDPLKLTALNSGMGSGGSPAAGSWSFSTPSSNANGTASPAAAAAGVTSPSPRHATLPPSPYRGREKASSSRLVVTVPQILPPTSMTNPTTTKATKTLKDYVNGDILSSSPLHLSQSGGGVGTKNNQINGNKEMRSVLSLPPPPTCFDASSLRLKLSYDFFLALDPEVEQEGCETMLKLFKNQREAAEESWPRQPPSLPTPAQPTGKEQKGVAEKALSVEQVEMQCDGSGVDEHEGAMNEGATSKAGRSAVLPRPSFVPTSLDAISGTPSSSARRTGGMKATLAAEALPASTTSVQPTVQSAYDFVTRLVAAATDEVNMLGVDDVAPHLWCRWAPHW